MSGIGLSGEIAQNIALAKKETEIINDMKHRDMMEVLKSQLAKDIQEAKPTLKKSSIDNYIASFGKFHTLKENRYMKHYYMRPSTIIKEIYKMKGVSNNTRKNYLSAIMNVMVCYKYNGKLCEGKRRENAIAKYRGAIYDLRKKIDEAKEKLKDGLTDKERDNMISYEQVQAGFNMYNNMVKMFRLDKCPNGTKLTGAEFDLLQRWVLTALYSFIPPARNEYATLECGHRDWNGVGHQVEQLPRDKNYLIWDKEREHNGQVFDYEDMDLARDRWDAKKKFHIIINQHKSNKSLGSRHFIIYKNGKTEIVKGKNVNLIETPNGLYNVLKRWYELVWITSGGGLDRPLFINKKGGRMNRNSLTKYLITTYQRLYPNKKISTNILRKAFHSSKDAEFKKEYEKKKVIAESMGHSIGEAMATYTKEIPK